MGDNQKNESPNIITNIQDFFSFVSTSHKEFGERIVWWRGQDEYNWELHPKVFRSVYGKPKFNYHETNLFTAFKSRAPARHSRCPDNDPDWLFFMQHYGLPTRLLDWTDSPLVGLFFAVKDQKYWDADGSLISLSPFRLNVNMIDINCILVPNAPDASRSFQLNPPEEDGKILAIFTPHFDSRMMLQQSNCTIHDTKSALEEMPSQQDFLRKYKIPKASKSNIFKELQKLGIMESYLFLDLDYFSKDLERDLSNLKLAEPAENNNS